MGLLDGKVAIVTGAGGGIGRCHALHFAREGARVVVNDLGVTRDGAGGEGQRMADAVVAEIQAAGGEAVANYDSVATVAGGKALVQRALGAFGRADILVNNAGILRDKTLLKLEEEMWDLVVAVHLKGTFACTQAFAHHVQERAEQGDRGGRVINTSSYAGLMGNYGQSNYAAAKAGIYALTKVWALELTKLGVTVNCLAPMAKTRMTEDIAMVPEEMRPEQVAPMALFLASERAAGVTGRVFGIHGQQLLEYRMLMTEGVTKEGDALWTPDEIEAKLEAIGADAPPPGGAPPPAAAAAAPLTDAQVIDRAFTLLPQVFVPEKAKGWTATVVFDIAQGSPWTVRIKDGTCTTERAKADGATCTVTVSAATYAAIVRGELKPDKAFMAGKVKASNLGDMMKFGQAFDMKKARELAKAEAARAAPAAAAAAPAAAAAAPAAAAGPLTDAQVIDRAFALLPQVFVPEKAKGWGAAILFDIAGASPWTVRIQDGVCTTANERASDPSCAVNVDAATYAAIVRGELKPDKAFMAGKIKASNLGDLMKFGQAFDMKKARELAKAEAAKTQGPAAAAAESAAPPSDAEVIDRAFGLLPKVFVPEKVKGWTATVVFDIAEGSPWTVRVKDGTCTTERAKAEGATCTVSVSAATYAAIVRGELKPDKAFMAGKIKATNLPDVMKFGQAFDMKKARALAGAEAAGSTAPVAAAAAAPQPGAPGAADPRAHVARAFGLLPDLFRPEAASGWKAAVQFQIEGGDDWTVVVDGGACRVEPGRAGEPTCVVKTTLADYARIVSGELKAEQAFMQRRLTASNLTDMMKFGRAFDMKRAKELLDQPAAGAAASGGDAAAAPRSGGLNRALLGKVYAGSEPVFVRPEHVALFAAATQDDNPRYDTSRDDAVAPPMFAVRLLKEVLFKVIGDEELGVDLLNLVHGEQEMEFLRPLRPWDLTATRARTTAVEDKGSGQLLRLEEEVKSGGETAVRVRASMFIRDPSRKKDAKKEGNRDGGEGAKPAAAAAPERGEPTFRETVTVPDDAGPRYAEASLDNNPIHTDPEVAKMAGFPGIILQGLCTMSFAAKAIVNQVLGGDPAGLARVAARFSRPVLMGDVLTTEGWATEERADEGGKVMAYAFRVVNQRGEEVIQNGVAEVRR